MKAVLLVLMVLVSQDKDTSKNPRVRHVTLNIDDLSITQVLDDLRRETGIPIEYHDSARKLVDPDKTKVSTKIQDISLANGLSLLLRSYGLRAGADEMKVVITAP